MLTSSLKTSQWILLLIPIVWHKELQNWELGYYLWPRSSPYFYGRHCPCKARVNCCEPVHSIAIFCATGHFFLTHPGNFILLNGQTLLMTDKSVLEPINFNIPFRNPLRLSIFYASWILVHRVRSWSIEHNRFPVFAPHNLLISLSFCHTTRPHLLFSFTCEQIVLLGLYFITEVINQKQLISIQSCDISGRS